MNMYIIVCNGIKYAPLGQMYSQYKTSKSITLQSFSICLQISIFFSKHQTPSHLLSTHVALSPSRYYFAADAFAAVTFAWLSVDNYVLIYMFG